MGLVKGLEYTDFLPESLRDVPRDVVDQAARDCKKDCNSWLAQLQRRVRRRVWRSKYIEKRQQAKASGINMKEYHPEFSKAEVDKVEAEIKREYEKRCGVYSM